MHGSSSRITVVVAALAHVLSACAGSETAVNPSEIPVSFGSPDEPGPYGVGVTTVEIDDGQSADRTLPVEIWYPASIAGGEPDIYSLMVGSIELAELPSPIGAVRNAPADLRGGPHPIVVFSHGNAGVRLQSYYLTEHLASHGFVVAAPDHVGNTMALVVAPESALPPVEVLRLRPTDVSRALDAVLTAAEDASHPIHGAADPARVGVAGHSFGGYTAFRIAGATIDATAFGELCWSGGGGLFCEGWTEETTLPESARDDRFSVALPQTPGGAAIIGGGFADITIPTFVQGGSTDRTTPVESEAILPYEKLGGEALLLVIAQAGHFTYSNMCEALELRPDLAPVVGDVLNDGCGDQNIRSTEAHTLINAYSTAFFHTSLAGRRGFEAWLDPATAQPNGVARFEKH